MSNTEIWINNLKLLEEYINVHKELPSDYSKDPNILKIARWKNTQKNNFKNTSKIMIDETIRTIWEEFVKRHYKLFRTNEEKWLDYLKELEEYIKIHNQLPSHTNKDENTRYLAGWISVQKENYKLNKQIMTNEEIRKKWEELVNKYQEVFKTTEEIWKDNLNNLKEYINIHNKLPTSCNQDETIKSLGLWTRNQAKNYDNKQYIMKNEINRILWEEFMKENNKLFLNNEELWIENKNKVEEYIQYYSKLPAQTDKIQDIAVLGNWIQSQKTNYIKKSKIMIDETIRTIWEDFVKQYEKYFMSAEEVWFEKKEKVEEYIQTYNKLPSTRDKLGRWVGTQKQTYKNKKHIMVNDNIRKEWDEFTAKYPHLF